MPVLQKANSKGGRKLLAFGISFGDHWAEAQTPTPTAHPATRQRALTSALGQSSLITLSILLTTSIRIFSSSGRGDMYS